MEKDFFPNALKSERKKANLTQKELAEKAGISVSTLQLYEYGKLSPTLSTIDSLAAALGVQFVSLSGVKRFQDSPGGMALHKQNILLSYYKMLNEAGKDKALERVQELTEIPRYTLQDPVELREDPPAYLAAAHADGATAEELRASLDLMKAKKAELDAQKEPGAGGAGSSRGTL